jgi:FlaA1/EpsC-like NDP-sugar epimerase
MSVCLVTGAGGSLGTALCKKLIARGDHVRAMDINECALANMNYPPEIFTKIYGDVSSYNRVMKAMRGVDIVYHLAALKNIIITEVNCPDCVRININGTLEIAEACMERGVKHAIFLSSDKACAPSTLYGASKQVGEHIWKASGRIQNTTKFTIVRSGNFFESNGNFWETWAQQKAEGKPITITDTEMRRYFIEVDDLCDILLGLPAMNQTVIPFMKEYFMMELMIQKYGENQEFIITGKRTGEKIREQLKYEDEKTVFICNDYEVVE